MERIETIIRELVSEELKERLREQEDLDSITLGSPSRCQIKVYFNAETDDNNKIQERILKVINEACAGYSKMQDLGLIGKTKE